MSPVKPHASTTQATDAKSKRRFGLPGAPKQRRSKIKAAIAANRETLRRLAK